MASSRWWSVAQRRDTTGIGDRSNSSAPRPGRWSGTPAGVHRDEWISIPGVSLRSTPGYSPARLRRAPEPYRLKTIGIRVITSVHTEVARIASQKKPAPAKTQTSFGVSRSSMKK